MDDLISRKAAIDAITKAYDQGTILCLFMRSLAIKAVNMLPSVDAVQVVRCRDCKYSYIFEPWEGKNAVRYCNQLRRAYVKDSDLPVYDDDFCSHGERRESNE